MVVPGTLTKANLEEFQKKEFLLVNKNYTYCKLGSINLDTEALVEKFHRIIKTLQTNNRTISQVKIKTTQGPVTILDLSILDGLS